MFDMIVVPLDGSELAERSLPVASLLAQRMGSTIHLVHVIDIAEKRFQRVYETYMEKVAESVRAAATQLSVVTDIQTGNPAELIAGKANTEDNSLIVMTRQGHSATKQSSMGSVMQKILRITPRSLLAINALQEDAGETEGIFRRILLPLEGSEQSEAVIPSIIDIAALFGSEVELLTVLPLSQRRDSGRGYDKVVSAERYLAMVEDSFTKKGVKVTFGVRAGNRIAEVLAASQETEASMVAMTVRGHSTLERIALGTVTDKVMRQTSVPVLLKRAQTVAAETTAESD